MLQSGQLQKKPLFSGSTNYAPHDYQKRAIKLMVSQACAGLFLDPGLGKTSISLAAFMLLGQQGYVKGVLVITPLRAVYNVWPNEIKKWKDFNDLSIGLLHGHSKDLVFGQNHDVYAINPEGVAWLVEKLVKLPVEQWPFDMLVVDESTKFKDSQTQRFKAIRRILHSFRRRYILTGTPTPNGLLDLFGQIFILDLGHALGRYITHYRNEYFIPSGFLGYQWTPKFDSMDRITQRVAPLVLRMEREDYLDLPELVQQMIWVDLPANVRAIYKDIEDKFIAEIGDDTIIAPSAAAAGVKCRQILNGAVYINPAHDWRELHTVKLDVLADLVEELSGQPLLVLYEFVHDKERILERFPQFAHLGGPSMKKDQVVIGKFNRGELVGVVGHPSSIGHALNLQGSCAHICLFGLTWNFEHYDQAIQRVWRQGNTAARVVAHHICMKNSLDEVVVKTLQGKDKTQAEFTRRIRMLR